MECLGKSEDQTWGCLKGVKVVEFIGKGDRKRENYGMEKLKQGGD